jgi:hypothetical protein
MNSVTVYDLAIQIEQKVSQLYSRFSDLFRDNLPVSRFWAQMAHHEKVHAETLLLSKGYLQWDPSVPEGKNLPHPPSFKEPDLKAMIERIRGHEKQVRKQKTTLKDAVNMMLEIENSEIGHLYGHLVHFLGLKRKGDSEIGLAAREHSQMIVHFLKQASLGGRLEVERLAVPESVPQKRKLPKGGSVIRTSKGPEKIGMLRGQIAEMVLPMGYGLIDGEDGRSYLFLPEDVEGKSAGSVLENQRVAFFWRDLPWGPRAYQIKIVEKEVG